MTESEDRVGVILVTVLEKPPTEHVLVLEGIRTADRPAAVGLFVFDIMREMHSKYGRFPEFRVRMGTIERSQLMAREAQGHDVRRTCMDGELIGEVYRLVVAVEHGDRNILNS